MQVLGIDVGSVSVSLALLRDTGAVVETRYAFHHGDVRATLSRLLQDLSPASVRGVACTSTTPDVLVDVDSYDWKVAYVEAARHLHGRVGSLLVVGGERFGMVFFDDAGGYLRYRSNSSCAAGTGSFLDQQARRLNVGGSEALARTALENTGDVPAIASRCSVFAKTDLIHAQQEGYSIEEICDGLCLGLARNVVDTVLTEHKPNAPLVMAGGVARNAAVVRHVERLVGMDVAIDRFAHCYGAIGACLLWMEEHPRAAARGSAEALNVQRLVREEADTRQYHYEPLSPELPGYPDFSSHVRFTFPALRLAPENPVEVDVYEPLPAGSERSMYLGIDIGSTSTKAVLLDEARKVVAGFYTRTAGRPIPAVQGIFQAIDALARENGAGILVRGAGTTGSGRKFIGKIIGADSVVDEISAHARAAHELDPRIDTIIEIGGQDSKFTTMQDGMVTFSQMNTVCAAGTGSFLEEQAGKLGVAVSDYAERAFGVAAPLTSDRCTVFMERDINHFLNRNYSVDAILAAALHSVRENYLTKVATRGAVGSHVCFQGATAKNRALVAAFAQKLRTPISVSRYCHLTGALGVALFLHEQPPAESRFRGLGLYRGDIPVERETCELCKNHCQIRVATVGGERVAYGFRCGRDDDAGGYVSKNRSGFSMLRTWKLAYSNVAAAPADRPRLVPTDKVLPTVGIPAALHLYEDLPLWKRFFAELGVPVVTSETARGTVKAGKLVSGAEFCAPMSALHGHVRYLQERADYVFLPIYLQRSDRDTRRGRSRQYCYYTQFAASVVSLSTEPERCITPLVRGGDDDPHTQKDLCDALRPVIGEWLSPAAVADAYDRALVATARAQERLRSVYAREAAPDDVNVVLLGRPYTVLSPEMNGGIPEIFGSLGVRAFFQDMVDYEPNDVADIDPLLDAFHWRFAAKILETAQVSTGTPGMYPVLITSFKCAPDSFLMEYFRRIMDAAGKPYLILQLDEHDSSVGYETRVEAAVRAFRNHRNRSRTVPGVGERPARTVLPHNPALTSSLEGKDVLFPNWDTMASPLLVEALRQEGIRGHLLEEDESLIRESMATNTGQCIPINIIVHEAARYIARHGLDPANTVVWMARAKLGCGITLYPYYIKTLLEAEGLPQVGVYRGDITFVDISPRVTMKAYFAFLFGGLLRRLGCLVRPYELEPGRTNAVIREAHQIFAASFRGEMPKEEAVSRVIERFDAIPRARTHRTKVAIFGDLYVRDNDVMNQALVEEIERAGGEVITTPYSDYNKIIAGAYFRKMRREGRYGAFLMLRSILSTVSLIERRYYSYFERYTGGPLPTSSPGMEKLLADYKLRVEHAGESFDNVLKIARILEEHPDVGLFVQTNPSFCCPSLVTEAMSRRIEELTGVPVVTLTYDGTGTPRNDALYPYLRFLERTKSRAARVNG